MGLQPRVLVNLNLQALSLERNVYPGFTFPDPLNMAAFFSNVTENDVVMTQCLEAEDDMDDRYEGPSLILKQGSAELHEECDTVSDFERVSFHKCTHKIHLQLCRGRGTDVASEPIRLCRSRQSLLAASFGAMRALPLSSLRARPNGESAPSRDNQGAEYKLG
ncbi:hypothetical protein STEG23_020013 [Scotinomys teguina]